MCTYCGINSIIVMTEVVDCIHELTLLSSCALFGAKRLFVVRALVK